MPTERDPSPLLEDLQRIEGLARAGVMEGDEPGLDWGETRPAAALHLDLVGYTELSHKLSSEELSLLTSKAFRIFELTARAHGGYCKEVVGDSALYLFPGHPNHAPPSEAALRAGREILNQVERINTSLSVREVELAVRMGASYGEVTRQKEVGEEEKLSVKGAAVNLSQRLEETGEPGELHATAEVLERAGDLAESESVGEAELKGVGTVERFRVLDVAEPTLWSRGEFTELTPFVSRDRELSGALEITRGWLDSDADEARLLLIQGPMAVGKSRLAYELVQRLDREYDPALATVHLAELNGVYNLARDLLDAAGLSAGNLHSRWDELCAEAETRPGLGSDYAERAREQFRTLALLLESGSGAGSQPQRTDPKSFLHNCQRALATCFELITQLETTPLVLVVEDLQWLGPGRELLSYLLTEPELAEPMVVVATARPEYHHGTGLGEHRSERIQLEEFTAEEGEAVLEQLLPGLELPEDLRADLHDKADGLPYFYEQFARMLVRRNLVERSSDGYRLSGEVRELDLPDDLTALVMGRLDSLPERLRRLLGRASVLGRRFDTELLREMDSALGIEGSEHPEEPLRELERESVIGRAGYGRWAFEHAITRDAVYESLLSPNRRRLHEICSELLEQRIVRGTPSHYELTPELVRHLEGAGELLRAHREQTELLNELVDAGRSTSWREGVARAQRLWEKLRERDRGIPEVSPWLLRARGTKNRRAGELDRALSRYREGLELARELADRELEAKLLQALGWVCWYQGRVRESCDYYEDSLELFRQLGDLHEQGRVLSSLGINHNGLGNPETARDYYERALAAARESGDRATEGKTLGNLGLLYFETRLDGPARENVERALEIAREIGDRRFEGIWLGNLGLIAKDRDETGRARGYFREAIRLFREIGDRRWLGIELSYLAELELDLGEVEAAGERLAEARELLETVGDERKLQEVKALQERHPDENPG